MFFNIKFYQMKIFFIELTAKKQYNYFWTHVLGLIDIDKLSIEINTIQLMSHIIPVLELAKYGYCHAKQE